MTINRKKQRDPGATSFPILKRIFPLFPAYFPFHLAPRPDKFIPKLSMPVRFQHDQESHSIYFLTFTCIKWKCLFQLASTWDTVYKWFDVLYTKNIRVTGYVIMPNHLHCLLYFFAFAGSAGQLGLGGKRVDSVEG